MPTIQQHLQTLDQVVPSLISCWISWHFVFLVSLCPISISLILCILTFFRNCINVKQLSPLSADGESPMCPLSIEQSTDDGSDGANVSFDMEFTDNVDPSPTASCDHPSGAKFPVGVTIVTCNVTDSSSNFNLCNFTIIVTGKMSA